MTLGWAIARAAMVTVVLGYGFTLLPPASVYDNTALSIPSVLWDPLVAVLHLNRYLPIGALLVIATIALGIQSGLAGFWIVGWVMKHVLGAGA